MQRSPLCGNDGLGRLVSILAVLVLSALSIVACSSDAEPTPPTPAPTVASPSAPTPDAAGGPPEVRLGLATVDLGVGLNRFAFGVRGADSQPVRTPTALATFMFIESTPYEVRAQAEASFVTWPTGRAGVYVVNDVELDKAGRWGLVVGGRDGGRGGRDRSARLRRQARKLIPGRRLPGPAQPEQDRRRRRRPEGDHHLARARPPTCTG